MIRTEIALNLRPCHHIFVFRKRISEDVQGFENMYRFCFALSFVTDVYTENLLVYDFLFFGMQVLCGQASSRMPHEILRNRQLKI